MSSLSLTIRRLDAAETFPDVASVRVPTPQGELHILSGHADLVSEITPGTCRLRHALGEKEIPLSARGLLKVHDNKILILI